MKVGVALLELLAGLELAVGALAALLAADVAGEGLAQGSQADAGHGSRVEVALVEAGVTA